MPKSLHEYGLARLCLFETLSGARDLDDVMCDHRNVNDDGPSSGNTKGHQRSNRRAPSREFTPAGVDSCGRTIPPARVEFIAASAEQYVRTKGNFRSAK